MIKKISKTVLSVGLSIMLILVCNSNLVKADTTNLPSTTPATQTQLDNLKGMTLDQLKAAAKPMPESSCATVTAGGITQHKLKALSMIPQDGNIYYVQETISGITQTAYYKALYASKGSTGMVNYYAYLWLYQNDKLKTSVVRDDSEYLTDVYAALFINNSSNTGTSNGGGNTSTGGGASTGNINNNSNGSSNTKIYTKKRLSGITRFDTADAIASEFNSGTVNSVVLATGYNFPDALAGSVLAKKLNAPMLLVGLTPVDSAVSINYIKDHLSKSGTVYALGGEGAVNETVILAIKLLGYTNIVRLSGFSRYDTCEAINNTINAQVGTPVIIATGNDFPDALSISPIAASKGYPIILTDSDALPMQSKETLNKIKPSNVYIIGGNGVISDNVENQIKTITGISDNNVVRIFGSNRYETSVNIAKYFNISSNNITFATGKNFPDALAGSILSAKLNAPLLLTGEADNSLQKAYLKNSQYNNLVVFGGAAAISDDMINSLTSN